ncbi:Luciferin 4-monooxygenase [Harpegnathos saltator]|uniref:Luciferin 4-monooxygenase n=1 Tax=Harpegnathos saltator TaxID=610380 RepID=E2B4F9_HARSA|nr:Luciferin 4-monooxygenase [Harpegnathos saltator]
MTYQIDALTGKQNTFQQMRERSVKCALWLRKQNVKPGDIIVTCTHNQLESYVPFVASMYIDVCINPWNEHSSSGSIEHFFKIVKPKVIFVNGNKAATILEVATKLGVSPKIVVFDETEGFESLESILNGHFDEAEVDGFSCTTLKKNNIRETTVVLFSSGTTGLPKAIEIPHTLFTSLSRMEVPPMSPSDVGLWFGSLSWITSVLLTIHTILSYATAIKCSGFDCEKVYQMIGKYKVTWMLIETGMCNRLVKSGVLTRYNISSLKIIIYGGSVNKAELHENLVKSLPDVLIMPIYGMTETGSISYSTSTGKFGSSGRICKNNRLMIADLNTGKPLGPNMHGEICTKSLTMMNGYYRDPENTKNIFDKDGWFHTGDLGYYDEDGYIFIVDRIKQLIKCKGHQVSPTEIEILLQSHPSVYESAVVPVPHLFDGQHPTAFVQKMSGAEVTAEELEQLVAMNMEDYKKLRGGVVFLENIPHVPNGKIDRKQLRNMAEIFKKK